MVSRWFSAAPAVALAACTAACTASAEDVRPDEHSIFFPTGLATSPDDTVAFVTSANSDLRYDSGTVQVIDLATVSQVVGAWLGTRAVPADCTPSTDGTGTLECDEAQFLIPGAAVRVGNFTSSIGVQDKGGGDLRLIVPVRGDPSITWIDWDSAARRLRCSDAQGFELCDDAHRLTRFKDDDTLPTVPTEPYGVYVDSAAQFAVVSHLSGAVTLVDTPVAGTPVLADVISGLFVPDLLGNRGAAGVAGRTQGDDDIVYVQSRSEDRVQTLSVGREPELLPFLLPGRFFFMDGVGPPVGGSDNGGSSDDARGITFDPSGDRAFMINRSPPSLQIYDTSIGTGGEPRNQLVATTDVCREASSVVVGDGGGGERAFVGCYGSGELYVIDPRGASSIDDVTTVGRGPFSLALAPTRQFLLVANFLEDSIAVVDLAPDSASLYRVVLRIGVRS